MEKLRKNKIIKYLLIASGLLLLLFVSVWIISLLALKEENSNNPYQHLYMVITSLVWKVVFVLIVYFQFIPKLKKTRRLSIFGIQVIAWLVICFFLELLIQSFFLKGSHPDEHGPTLIGNNPFWWMNLIIYILVLIMLFAWHFTIEWVRNEKQKRVLIEIQLNSELNYLKSQINPHFLFNTLNNLFSIAQKNNIRELEYGISRLSGLMRYMIYDSNVNLVVLSKEVNNMKDFIGVCQLRYPKDEVQVNFVEKGNPEQAYIAPMILIPFIENAFKHGVNIENKSLIDIYIEATDKKIIFECSNEIFEKGLEFRTDAGGIGLENVKRRLQLLYPQKHELIIKDEGKKYHVKLRLTTIK